jgi:hypothetical protein
MSVTLTADTLRIRNVLTARDIPLNEIADVRFRRSVLRVTRTPALAVTSASASPDGRHARPAGSRGYTVSAVRLGAPETWAGQRAAADDVANVIAAAACLPPLAVRKAKIDPRTAVVMIIAGLACLVTSFILTPSGVDDGPLVLHLVTSMLEYGGVILMITGVSAAVGHAKRRRAADAS